MRKKQERYFKRLGAALAVLVGAYVLIISIPLAYSIAVTYGRHADPGKEFPVTVDPERKLIVESAEVNQYLSGPASPLQAGVGNFGTLLGEFLGEFAASISGTMLYAPVAAVEGRLVTVRAGLRKEQVARMFGAALGWTKAEERQFLEARGSTSGILAELSEGYFSPGVYVVSPSATPIAARSLVDARFEEEVLSRYSSRVSETVPLKDALTIASLIQREAAGPADMRLVSGVIWNRLFINMRLQIDATVQYARANSGSTRSWWPAARPADLSIDSLYNTYKHKGLPPGPIANPSVAAVLAALNPVATDCMFYFHDRNRSFHCSPTYEGHVTLLKKHYGRGK